MLQWCSQDSLWPTGWWEVQDDMEAADREGSQSRSSRLLTLMIDIPGDLVWDLLCMQQASNLEEGPLMWMLPLYLHVNQKSSDDDDDDVLIIDFNIALVKALFSIQKYWYFSYFSRKTYIVGHNICFCGEIRKIFTGYPPLSRPYIW